MTAVAFVLATSAVLALLLAGFLLGARVGRTVRRELLRDRDDLSARGVELETKLGSAAIRTAELEAKVVRAQQAAQDAVVQAAATPGPRPEQLKAELEKMLAPILAAVAQQATQPAQLQATLQQVLTAQRGDGATEIRKVMSELLAPVMERERVGQALSSIRVAEGGLRQLPRMLDEIAAKGGFAAMVLSDEAGLPLAASTGSHFVEEIAGVAAFFLTLADRAERASLPPPLACVVLDQASQTTLHRIFKVGDVRFTVSALSRGQTLVPGALDGALAPLQRLLTAPG